MLRNSADRHPRVLVPAALLVLLACSLGGPGCSDSNEVTGPPKATFQEKALELRWVCYSPSTYVPGADSSSMPTVEDIRADLRFLHPYFDGLITYGLGEGLARIPQIAKEEGYDWFIAGIWDIRSEEEFSAAVDLAGRDLVDAFCVGNEGLGVRYSWEELQQVIAALKDSTGLPVTTTEQVEDYADGRLAALDFLFPNVHPLWHGLSTADAAAEWVCGIAEDLLGGSPGRVLLIKESGFPSSGPDYCTEDLQADFWQDLLARSAGREWNVAFFEAFDQDWKHETYQDEDVGPHWGAFRTDRRPKKVVEVLVQKGVATR
jgi:exo-beta-1,3-glucanase (GH17 family)